jgi:aryl-alcohol dehydrogenase-like predicted oxidoreductase
MPLSAYRTLGRSGLVVSPLALGTMTFGTARWGTDEKNSQAIFNAYVDAGGNFVDTADVYASGRGEELLGRFIAERGLREQVVLATKAGFAAGKGVQNGGSGAKHLHTALEGSLRRLGTQYVDVFWLHVWDSVTPAEELLGTMAALVRTGKTRYWGMSNAPAWYVAKVATLAAARGLPGPIAMQYFYSLVNRDIEDEHVPVADEFGMAIVPWSPLAYGLLTGKYNRSDVEAAGPRAAGLPRDVADGSKRPEDDKRLDGANPFGDSLFTEQNWKIVDVLQQVAKEAQQPPARVALAWVVGRPGVTSTLMGASRAVQVTDNAAALDMVLSDDHRKALDEVSTSTNGRMLYSLFTPAGRQHVVFGGNAVGR